MTISNTKSRRTTTTTTTGHASTQKKGNNNNSEECGGGDTNDKYDKYDRKKRKQSLITLLVVMSVCLSCILWKRQKILARKFSSSFRSSSHSSNNNRRFEKGNNNNLYRWVDERHLPPLPGSLEDDEQYWNSLHKKIRRQVKINDNEITVSEKNSKHYSWEDYVEGSRRNGPLVDYTNYKYSYPKIFSEAPPLDGSYPSMDTFGNIMDKWSQFDIDNPPATIHETLQHFDYQDPEQMKIATFLRDNELPFKIVNVPELKEAEARWTDDYLSWHYDRETSKFTGKEEETLDKYGRMPKARGRCQESRDSYFAFFNSETWVQTMFGPPPSRDLDFTFSKFAKHATYADENSISHHDTHYYFQSGVPREERNRPKQLWSFISRDLPSFSNPEPTFFGFNPREQKGIQCRFGERGVTAATHYDAGRNMVAMIKGAKRYILSPPIDCPKLAIMPLRGHPSFRHSMLNFGHLPLLVTDESKGMSQLEREWLQIASKARVIDTVLKSGEVLYIPSHWFHYIISLQKSAQCNTRSGRDRSSSQYFGGYDEIQECMRGNA